ncbi:hypothetical protein KW850_31395 [Bacillus sp. sid0103]|uniref:hypothetical protein n=1 Tax=Bacillus sp. sid0103 TaxID=2856337 RepID=UPI001C45B6CE|nr:hypothetical protein [Bacillus sp. sid0103]MBV7509628.1 hypothetical protein [Bacillus sp. sid0103]
MKKMQTAKEVLEHIKNLEAAERYKVVKEIVDYSCGPRGELLRELILEYIEIKKDVEYLSGKIGLHDMYLNRIKKEISEINDASNK